MTTKNSNLSMIPNAGGTKSNYHKLSLILN